MYGELDPYYIPNGLLSAKQNNGVLQRVGDGKSLFQQAYVGNVAWAHIQAMRALRTCSNQSAELVTSSDQRDHQNTCLTQCGGKVFFVPDDTPLLNSFTFIEYFLRARGYNLSEYSLPYSVVYWLLYAVELGLAVWSPVQKVNLNPALCSVVYINTTYYFNRKLAEELLNYKPIFTFEESLKRSIKYYSGINI
jgi:3beta-hydroxy-delta5-steroid dehydrogenase / steroid delta-isomerase